MIVRIITVSVKSEFISEFEKETTLNHRGSIDEPGVLRFDVLKDAEVPGRYVLYEVYVDEQATRLHKETQHYARWKAAVEPMMAGPRESAAYSVIAPIDPGAW